VPAAERQLGHIFGVAEELGRASMALASLTALGADARVADHTHTNPYLSLHVLGGYCEHGEDGDAAIAGPAAIFHPAGSAHQMTIGRQGFASVIVEFDPAWLRRTLGPWAPLDRSRQWVGGAFGRRAAELARAWLNPRAPLERRLALTEDLLRSLAVPEPPPPAPPWLERLQRLGEADGPPPALAEVADRCGVGRPWMARAYRRRQGEGLGETLRRRRVEAAVLLLESTGLPLATVAAEAGFCDQSHMNRGFSQVLGRTPAAMRRIRLGLAGAPAR